MKKGTKIILIIVGILILIGLAYYFLVYKPSKAGEKIGSGSNSSSGSTTSSGSGCVPYTQAQQDADMQKCATECSKLPFMKQAACMIACNNNKKPVKTC